MGSKIVRFAVVSSVFCFVLFILVVEQLFPSGSGFCDPGISTVGKLQHHKTRQNLGEVSVEEVSIFREIRSNLSNKIVHN